ncbi:AlwI family type II restriction endonuclease [Leuconostoc mesenteroides]|uniref:AlwI family type II restriction endonuclease n=1 Tax=Leuconostoc mesenteroides TaxID=1245 RepID=UPI00235F3116|nr:AlwI family type II restriction endonuclease [Leuconostoc mesenteroides]
MKLLSGAGTFNLGDTSFRTKTLIEDYKTILPLLKQINNEFEIWDRQAQSIFYKRFLEQTTRFERSKDEDLAKRGRTLTNALVKIGLVDNKRSLSTVAIDWLNNSLKPMDQVEKLLGIDNHNLLFLRQLLKLRVYDVTSVHSFYPFRVALELLIKYNTIPQRDFLTLIHLIQPTFDETRIELIINNYEKVVTNNQVFAEFIDDNFPEDAQPKEKSVSISDLFNGNQLDRELFDQFFVNRKTGNSQEAYFEFVTKLLAFKKESSFEKLQSLISISKNNQVKKAFGFGKSVFKPQKSVSKFYKENTDNMLLSDNNTDIYTQFVLSKKEDIIKEYRDMTKRTFNLTGLFDFGNGLVSYVNQDVFKIIFRNLSLTGTGIAQIYESERDQLFYQDISISAILNLDTDDILNHLKNVLKVDDESQLMHAVISEKERNLKVFIEQKFPKSKILQILPLFSERKDDEIHNLVSESASIPTIFEYIVGIAWYHISDENFILSQSLNLTLDGNMLPLSHAAGGAGDIIIDYKEFTLMIEVTLMNEQAQKRGEWEPVLRHATNLTVENSSKNVLTLFIADRLDDNTINIWRAVAGVPMKSSNRDEFAKLVKIFPLTNNEIIRMLEQSVNERKLIKEINSTYDNYATDFDLSWRTKILENSNIFQQ